MATANIGPCDCCPPTCSYVECVCCDSPCGLVPDRYRFTFDSDFIWIDSTAHFVRTLVRTVDVIGSDGCLWAASIPSNSTGGDPTIQFICCDGVWYLAFFAPSIDVTSVCHYLVFSIAEEFDCCGASFPQTLTLTPLSDVSGICDDLWPCSDPSAPPFYVWPSTISVTMAGCECPTDCNICTDCCDPETECTPATMFAEISSACAEIDGLVVELMYNGTLWTGTETTGCATCNTVTITLFCDEGVWDFDIEFSGTSANPSPPPDTLNCNAPGQPFPCVKSLDFDCSTQTGEAVYCLASLGNQLNGAACCLADPTTIVFSPPP